MEDGRGSSGIGSGKSIGLAEGILLPAEAVESNRSRPKSLTFPPLSIAGYSFMQLNPQTVAKGDSNPGSHDCESGILPLSYRAPHSVGNYAQTVIFVNSVWPLNLNGDLF